MFIWVRTRSKTLVEELAAHGVCIAYKRLLKIQEIIADIRCKEFKDQCVVSSTLLEQGFFTQCVIDNVDTIQTSVSAKKDAINATSISIFQNTFENDF